MILQHVIRPRCQILHKWLSTFRVAACTGWLIPHVHLLIDAKAMFCSAVSMTPVWRCSWMAELLWCRLRGLQSVDTKQLAHHSSIAMPYMAVSTISRHYTSTERDTHTERDRPTSTYFCTLICTGDTSLHVVLCRSGSVRLFTNPRVH